MAPVNKRRPKEGANKRGPLRSLTEMSDRRGSNMADSYHGSNMADSSSSTQHPWLLSSSTRGRHQSGEHSLTSESNKTTSGTFLLPDMPHVTYFRRGTLIPASSTPHTKRSSHFNDTSRRNTGHISDSSSLVDTRRHTVVMPLMGFFARQHRANSRSLSFRSSSMLLPAGRSIPRPLENTYKTEPDKLFPTERTGSIMAATLEERLSGKTYKAGIMAQESKILSDLIKERVKAIAPNRYKLVSWVTIGEKGPSDVRVTSRGVWNEDHDCYTEQMFENSSLYAVAVLYAVYQE